MEVSEENPSTIRFLCTNKHLPSDCGVSSLHTDKNSVKKRKMNTDGKKGF